MQQALPQVPATIRYFATTTEGLEFIAAKEILQRLPEAHDVSFEDGRGLLFFSLPSSIWLNVDSLICAETVFVYVNECSNLPTDESALAFLEDYATNSVLPQEWEPALRVWLQHFPFTEIKHDDSKVSDGQDLSLSAASLPLAFRISCQRKGDQPWQAQQAAGCFSPLLSICQIDLIDQSFFLTDIFLILLFYRLQ